ncbi:MAG: thioredoxin family protein [Planctomycetales bacterium]|nr:thioredoxin family protein [Planctomycetales bacterium]
MSFFKLVDGVDKLILPAIILGAIAYFALNSTTPQTATDTESWFEDAVAGGPVLVKFGAEWCGPCRQMDAVMDEYENQPEHLRILRVNIDEHHSLAQHFGIRSIPHMLVFDEGRVVSEKRGSMSREQFFAWADAQR